MNPVLIGAGISALASLASSKISSDTQQEINQQNLENVQRENDIMRSREDNAVQRRSFDLVRSGLSPTLAAGSSASSQAGQVYSILNNPKSEFSKGLNYSISTLMNAYQLALNAQGVNDNTNRTNADVLLTASKVQGQNIDNSLKAAYGAQELEDKHIISSAQADEIKSQTTNNIIKSSLLSNDVELSNYVLPNQKKLSDNSVLLNTNQTKTERINNTLRTITGIGALFGKAKKYYN